MPDHLSAEQVTRYREKRIPPEELLQVDDHISQCAECRERLAPASELRAALQGAASIPLLGQARDVRPGSPETASRGTHFQDKSGAHPPAAPENEHLAYEQLESYVDRKQSDTEREIARAHLEYCQSCSDDARDLNTFKFELADSKGQLREGWWAAFVALLLTRRRVALTLATEAVIVMAVAVEGWKSTSQ